MRIEVVLYILAAAGVTYLVRMLPLALIRGKITSRFARSFFDYIPYAVLAAMTIPAVFYTSTGWIPAAVGFAVAVVLSLFNRSLILVSVAACAATYLAQLLF